MVDKSKIPDLAEVSGMAGKLFKDVKQSVTEIFSDYKEKHPGQPAAKPGASDAAAEAKPATPSAEEVKKEDKPAQNVSDQASSEDK